MIDDENHPRMIAATKEIGERIAQRIRGRQLDKYLMQMISDLCYDHRNRWRQRDVDFPRLTAMVVPRIGAIGLYRADLDRAGVRGAIVQFCRVHPSITIEESAWAAVHAWPHIRPGDLVEEGAAVVTRDKQKALANAAEEA